MGLLNVLSVEFYVHRIPGRLLVEIKLNTAEGNGYGKIWEYEGSRYCCKYNKTWYFGDNGWVTPLCESPAND